MTKNLIRFIFILSWSQIGTMAQAQEQTLKDAGFTDIQELYPNFYKNSKVNFTHRTSLDAFVLSGTGWDKDRVVERYQEVADVLAKCGVEIRPLKIVLAKPPKKWQGEIFQSNDYNQRNHFDHLESTETENTTLDLAENLSSSSALRIFHVKGFLFNQHSHAVDHDALVQFKERFGIEGKAPHDKLKNTVWMASEVETDPDYKAITQSYSVEAHELAHILLREAGHKDEYGDVLTQERTQRGRFFTEEQCKTVRNRSELIRPISVGEDHVGESISH